MGMGTSREMRLKSREAIADLLAADESSVKTGAPSKGGAQPCCSQQNKLCGALNVSGISRHCHCLITSLLCVGLKLGRFRGDGNAHSTFRGFFSIDERTCETQKAKDVSRLILDDYHDDLPLCQKRCSALTSCIENVMNAADQALVRNWLSQACIILLVCISLAAPPIVFSAALPFFKAEALLVPFVLAVYIWLFMIGVARPIHFNGMFAIGLLFFICNLFSIWYAARILGHPVLLRDLYELPKVWLPVAFFTIAYEARLNESSIRRLISFFSVSVLLVCIYAWSQFFGSEFTYTLNRYYSMGGHIDAALKYAGRVYATMGNPNVLGELMAFCVVLFVLAALFRLGSALRNILLVLSCLITLVMTGSRYGVLDISVAFLLILMFATTTGRRRSARLAVLFVLLPTFVWIFAEVAASNPKTLERYQTLKQPLRIDSLRERVEGLWLEGWSDFKRSPLFGHGPGKAFLFPHGRVIDSEYLDVLREKGIIGFIVFLGYYLYPLYLIKRGRRAVRVAGWLTEQAPGYVVCINASLIMGILALIMDIGMATFYTPFLQGFLWLWLGIGAGAAARLSVVAPLRNNAYGVATHLQPQQASV